MEADRAFEAPATSPAVVTLRPFTPSDLDAATEWLMDDRVGRNMRWKTCKTLEEAKSYLENTILPHPWCRAICVEGGKPVGFIYATPLEGVDACRAELGCSISAGYWGNGIAATAARKAAGELLRIWPQVERLEARADVRNLRSQRVLEKAGFRAEAIQRKFRVVKGEVLDMVLYTFLRPRSNL